MESAPCNYVDDMKREEKRNGTYERVENASDKIRESLVSFCNFRAPTQFKLVHFLENHICA